MLLPGFGVMSSGALGEEGVLPREIGRAVLLVRGVGVAATEVVWCRFVGGVWGRGWRGEVLAWLKARKRDCKVEVRCTFAAGRLTEVPLAAASWPYCPIVTSEKVEHTVSSPTSPR